MEAKQQKLFNTKPTFLFVTFTSFFLYAIFERPLSIYFNKFGNYCDKFEVTHVCTKFLRGGALAETQCFDATSVSRKSFYH